MLVVVNEAHMAGQVHDALVQAAMEVRQHAYARYSKFLVGAALLTADGQIFLGCNVENGSYGLTICAERAAVFAAIAAGQQKFDRLAIATTGGATPCGACRQVLAEFAPELPILLVDIDRPGSIVEVNLRDLLPGAFTFSPDK
jgi:cytidine deaminase